MSSGLDLNCEASPVLHNHGTCVEDPPVNTGSGVLEMEMGGDEKKECERGLADREEGIVSDGEGSGGSDIEGESEVGVGGSVTREAGAESHVGEILEVDLPDKGIIELAVLATEELRAVEASSQPIDLVDESVDDQERGTDVNTEGVVGNDEDSLAVLSGDGGDAGECLEGSSFLRKEEIDVQAGLVDGGGQVVDGKLDLEELKTEVDSHCAVLLEVVTGESESSEVVDTGNQPMILEDGSIDDHKQGSDDQLTHRGSEPEDKFHNSNFLEMEERSPILVTVSTKGFNPVEASSHATEFQDGSCGDQKEGTSFDAEGMVIDDALIPTKEEDEVASLGAKVSEVSRGEKESTKLVVVSDEGFGPVKRSSQPTDLACESDIVQLLGTDLDVTGTVKVNDFSVSSSVASSEELVAVSTEVFEPVKAIRQAIDLADGSADVPVFGTELDEKGRVGIHDDSVSNCAGVGVKMLELGRVERGIAELDSSTEVFEPIQASSQAIDLSDASGDIQMRVIDAYANDTIRISEDSVRISSELFEPVKSSSQDIDLGDEFADVERRGTDLESEILELEGEENEGAETEVFELDNASTQAKDLGDGCGDDRRLGTVIETVVGIGNNEDSVAISVDNGGPEDEIQGDLGDGRIQIVDGELGTGKREEKVKSFGDGCMEVDRKEKGIPELGDAGGMDLGDGCAGDVEQGADVGIKGIARTDDSLAVLASGGAVGGESSEGSLILRGWVDVQVDLLDDGSQLCPGERESEFESHGGVLSKVGPREMERSDLVSVSAEKFEDNESNDRGVNLGDGSFGDQKLEIDVDADVLVADGQLGPGERDTKLKSFSGDGFDGDQKGGTMVMDSELGREDEHQSHGRNFSEVNSGERGSAEAMVTTTEEFAVISVVSGGPEDETLEESLVLRKEQIDVQGDFVDGSSQVGHGELGDSELIRHGEVDMGEKESTKLVSSSAEWPVVVEASSQAMDVGDGSDSDKKPETVKDTDDVGNEDSVTVGVPEHLVDGCCQVVDSEEGPIGKENELESHDGKLLAVALGEKAKEVIAVSAEKFEAVEVSGQAMDLGDESDGDQTQGVDVNAKDTIGTSDDSAAVSAGGGVSENERLEESSVFRIEQPVEVLRKLVYGCGQVADGELINGERLHVVESDDEKLLKVETEEERSAELFAISVERAEAVEASQAIDMKDGSGGDQKTGTDVDAKFMFGKNEDSVNGSLEGTLHFGDELIEAQEDLVDGDDQVLNDVFGLGKGEGEVDRHSEILLEMDAGEIRSTELASVSVVASSQNMDLEDGYSSDKKHDSSIVSESAVRIDDDYVTVSVNSGGPEDELLEGSFNFVKEDVEFGDDTNGTGAAVEDLAQPMNNKDIGVETLVHATQFRTKNGGGPEDVKFGENQIVDEEAVTQPGLSETKFAHPAKIGSGEIDVMRNAGHVNDTVNSEHADNLSSREGFNGDNMSESCVEADADQLVSHISCQGTEAQELEGAKKSDCEQVEIKYSGDGSQMMENFDQLQKNGDRLNVDVNEGDPREREGELVGYDGHSQREVSSEFLAGGESMDHQPLDETVVADGLGTFQSTVLELMGGETVLPHHSTVDSNPVEVRTDASSGENDQKIYDENDTVAGESVQKLDNTVEKVEVLVDNGLVKSAMPAELQNASAHKNFDYQNQKEDSSSTMVSFREEEHAADPHLLDNFFIEKEHSIMEDSDSIFGISMPEGSAESDNLTATMQLNESSVGYRDVRPPNAEFEHGQSLQDGNFENLKESDNQIEGCGDTSIETLTSRQASTELASVSVVASSQDMDLEDGYSSDKKHDSSIVSESVVRIDEDHITVSVNSGGPEVDLLEGSFNFVKEDVDFGDDTNGTGAAVENLAQPMNNKDIGVDTLVHATQFRTEYGDGGPDDVKFGENQIVDEEAVTQPGLSETKFAHPEKIGSGEIDVMRNAGHVNDTVNSEHAENRSSREGFNGDNMSESCVEADADQLVSHISCQGTEAQELEGAKKSDCEQVEIKYSGDGSQMMEKFDQIQKNGDPLNVDVNEGDPHEREGELVGNDGHSQSEVISEFSAGGESMDHQPLDQTVVTDSLGTFQSTVLELMGGETVLPHHSTVDSNPVEVRTDASSGENDQKIYDENDTVAGESVQKLDNTVEKVEVLVDNGLVKSVTPTELQNASAHKNSVYQNQKEDSSSTMVSFREEEHAADPHLLGNFFIEKEHSIMEDSDSIFGISMPEGSAESDNPTVTMQLNESSVGCRDVRPPNAEFEHRQSLQDGNCEHLKESDNQIQGCGDTSIETLTSRQASYDLSFPEKEGFSTSDLVWGKVKSHPWWPGQIFDFSGASKLALKYQKKDHFLVAYFGDKTFAWCEESRLKPFQLNFSQMEKQTSSDTFSRALHDILVEISRRVELSMTCLCLPEETYADIEYQKVENAGVRGKTVNSVFDRYEIVNYFRPDKLLEYVSDLALLPTGGADRLELTVAQAQLKAFYLSKGYTELPSFTNGSGLLENDFEIPISMSRSMKEDDLDHSATLKDLFSTKGKSRLRDGTLGKQKLIVKDGRKQKSLSELMEEEKTYAIVNGNKNASEVRDDERQLSSGNKRKSVGLFSMDTERIKMKKTVSQADKGTTLSSPIFNRSFKVGEFISRAASKLTCGRPLRKCHDEKADDWTNNYMDIDEFLDVPFDSPKLQIDISEDYPPASDLLSKLCLAARNPLKGYNFSSIVISFFSAFRNLQVSNFIEMSKTEKPRAKRGRKKKIIPDLELSDTSTPDHMKDSYWSDMIVPEKDAMSNPPKRRGRKKKKFIEDTSLFQVLNSPSDCESKLHIGSGCPHGKHILMAERPIITVEEKFVDERTPTAVILYFNSSDSLPSDTDLIRIFSRYGPLKEEETSVETKTNSAMVVFKKRADAEMAFSSAGKIGTFGPALLSYRLRHFPAKSAPVNTVDDPPPTTDGDSRILAELESVSASDGKGCENFPPVRSKDVDIDSSYFNQPRMDAVSTRVETGGADEFSNPPQDAPVQTQTSIVSENLLLESVDQEFSYFDLEFAESGVVSGNMQIETVCPPESGGKSSDFLLDKAKILQVSHEEIPSQVAMGISESLPDQSERAAEISDESSVAVDVLPSPLVSDSAHF